MSAALNYDLMRSLGGGQPWLLLEHAASAVNWREVNVPKRPGLMRLWAYQALAHGSDGVMFFQWRAARAAPRSSTARWSPTAGRRRAAGRDASGSAASSPRSRRSQGSTARAEVAFLFGWDNWWAFDGADHPSQLLDLPTIVRSWYRPFFDAEHRGRLRSAGGELDGYRLVVAPNLYLLTDEALEALDGVRRGRRRLRLRLLQRRRRRERPRPLAGTDGRTAAAAGRPGRRVLADPAGRGGRRRARLRCGARSRATGRSGSSSTAASRSRATPRACSRAVRP